MFTPFHTLSPDSKIWIYQADRKLTPDQIQQANTFLTNYCDRWAAHGNPLKASFDIRYSHFIIIAADESFNSTSGCSIDDSVRAIKEVQSHTGIDFLNRNVVGFLEDEQVVLMELSSLKQNYTDGMWNESTLSFNNLVTSKIELENLWIVPAGKTWLKRYLPVETIKT
jgi:hypothetical protein